MYAQFCRLRPAPPSATGGLWGKYLRKHTNQHSAVLTICGGKQRQYNAPSMLQAAGNWGGAQHCIMHAPLHMTA
jgi:hypothetical protein